MHNTVGTAAALEPRHQSTRTDHIAVGLPIPRPTHDASVLIAFVAGVVVTAAMFFAASPFLVHH